MPASTWRLSGLPRFVFSLAPDELVTSEPEVRG